MPLAMLALPRKLVRQSRIIGYWASELPKVPADWLRGMRFVHEIWVPSKFTAQALAEMAREVPIRLSHIRSASGQSARGPRYAMERHRS